MPKSLKRVIHLSKILERSLNPTKNITVPVFKKKETQKPRNKPQHAKATPIKAENRKRGDLREISPIQGRNTSPRPPGGSLDHFKRQLPIFFF
jgi:hypothetical protein